MRATGLLTVRRNHRISKDGDLLIGSPGFERDNLGITHHGKNSKVISVYGFLTSLSLHSRKVLPLNYFNIFFICITSGSNKFYMLYTCWVKCFHNLSSNYFWNFLQTSDRGDLSRERRQCLLCGWKTEIPRLGWSSKSPGEVCHFLFF